MTTNPAASRGFLVGAYICRALALLLSVTVIIFCFGSAASLSTLGDVLNAATSFVPGAVDGLMVFATPFDGAFRGDLAISAVLLFFADWVFMRIASAMR